MNCSSIASRYGSGRPSPSRSPEPRIAREHQLLAGHVLLDHERTEAHDLRQRRASTPGIAERAGLERGGQLVPRQNRNRIQHREPRPVRRGQDDDDGGGVEGADLDGLAVDQQARRDLALDLRVEQRLEGEDHVGRGERGPVREGHALRAASGPGQAVGRGRPVAGQPGLELAGRAVQSDQSGVGQPGDQVLGQLGRDQPVERLRFRSVSDRQPAPETGLITPVEGPESFAGAGRVPRQRYDPAPAAARITANMAVFFNCVAPQPTKSQPACRTGRQAFRSMCRLPNRALNQYKIRRGPYGTVTKTWSGKLATTKMVSFRQ